VIQEREGGYSLHGIGRERSFLLNLGKNDHIDWPGIPALKEREVRTVSLISSPSEKIPPFRKNVPPDT